MVKPFLRISLIAVSFTALLFQTIPSTRAASSAPEPCQTGTRPSGARYQVCLPEGTWNGDLIVYAHGYVPPGAPLALPGEAEAFSASLRMQGYAFATTSYRVNGLAVLPAQADLFHLVQVFRSTYDVPKRVFLLGASEGGLITTLALEHYPDVFAGGVEMCGPVGSFQDQVNYFGDFRVVFDALFPGLLEPGPVHIPQELVDNWYSIYQQRVLPVLMQQENRSTLIALMQATGAAYDAQRPETIETTIRGVLGYNILATNDAEEKLGGQPFDNQGRTYAGSASDSGLNQRVQRFTADPAAIQALQAYQTTGQISVPLVALHTTGDEIVPYAHVARYRAKVDAAGRSGLFAEITIERYGHCNFTETEIQNALNRLVTMANTPHLMNTATVTPAVVPPTDTPAANHPAQSAPTVTTTPAAASHTPAPSHPLANLLARLVKFLSGLVKL